MIIPFSHPPSRLTLIQGGAVEIPAKLLIANTSAAAAGGSAAAAAATIDVAEKMNVMFEQLAEMKGDLAAANGKIDALTTENAGLKTRVVDLETAAVSDSGRDGAGNPDSEAGVLLELSCSLLNRPTAGNSCPTTVYVGTFTIASIEDLDRLRFVSQINGSLIVSMGTESAVEFDSTIANNLVRITGRLYVNGNGLLESIIFENLEVVEQSVTISTNPELKKINLPKLERVGADFDVKSNRKLEAVATPVLSEINADLTVSSNPKLEEFSTPALAIINGTLNFQGSSDLTSDPPRPATRLDLRSLRRPSESTSDVIKFAELMCPLENLKFPFSYAEFSNSFGANMILQVQKTGTYKIIAAGGAGGNINGKDPNMYGGAYQGEPYQRTGYPASTVTMSIVLQANDTLVATVGMQGGTAGGFWSSGNGGGATFISRNGWSDILAVGAGGAGASHLYCSSEMGSGGTSSASLPTGGFTCAAAHGVEICTTSVASFVAADVTAASVSQWTPGSNLVARGAPHHRQDKQCSGGGAGYLGGAKFQGGAPYVHSDALTSSITSGHTGQGLLSIEFLE